MNSLIGEERLKNLAFLVRATKDVPGDMAELGVYQGGSARIIAENGNGRLLHLFDTFTGIPSDDSMGDHKMGEFASNLEDVQAYLKGYSVAFHPGTFPGSAAHLDNWYSFVHLDADTYQSTTAAIRRFMPRMSKDGIMVFDDYCWYKCPGVTLAVHDAFEMKHIVRADKQCWVIFKEGMCGR